MACSVWKVPWLPVIPWQMTLVFLSTRTAIRASLQDILVSGRLTMPGRRMFGEVTRPSGRRAGDGDFASVRATRQRHRRLLLAHGDGVILRRRIAAAARREG